MKAAKAAHTEGRLVRLKAETDSTMDVATSIGNGGTTVGMRPESSAHGDWTPPPGGARLRVRRDTHNADGTVTRRSLGGIMTAAGAAARGAGDPVVAPGSNFDAACAFARLVRWTYSAEPLAPVAATPERKSLMARKSTLTGNVGGLGASASEDNWRAGDHMYAVAAVSAQTMAAAVARERADAECRFLLGTIYRIYADKDSEMEVGHAGGAWEGEGRRWR